MKIKRLIAGGLAAVAIGTTLIAGGLAATTFDKGMGEFVTISGGTLSSPVIVVGAGVDTTDVLGATDIAASLVSNYAVQDKVAAGAGAATSVSNGVLIDSSFNKTYADEALYKVKTVLTETNLPDLLKSNTFTDINSTVSTYTQKIVLGNTYGTFGVPSGDTEPYLYLNVPTTISPYNLTVTFIGGLDPTAVDSTLSLKLFGKEYTFGNTHDNNTLELYSSAGAQVLDFSGSGDEKTVTVGDKTFTIKLNGWNGETATIAYFTVNGESKAWTEGSTYTVNDVKFYVQSVDVIYTGAQSASGMVKLFVGTDKLLLQDQQQVQKNDETQNTYVYFSSTTANKINSLTFVVNPEDDAYVKDGGAFVDPVFGSFKTLISGMTPGLTDASRDLIKLASDSTNVKLSFKNKDGMQYTNVPISYSNSSGTFAKINNANYFRTKECNGTDTSLYIGKSDYFVLASGEYSYVLKYNNYNYDTDDSKIYVTLTDLATNSNYKVYANTSGETVTIGSLQFPIKWMSDTAKTICVDFNGDTSYNGAIVNVTTIGRAQISLSNASKTVITEDDLYSISGSNDPDGTTLNVAASYSSTTGVRLTESPSADQVGTANEWKDLTAYGSYIYITGDTNGRNSISMYNPGERPASINIAIGTNPVISTSTGAAGGAYKEAVPVTNPIAKFPSEVTQTASLDKDLILVGGPCANAIVKTLLNTAWNSTDSCAAWLADVDLKDNGKGLIQVVEGAFGSGHKALIVAGTSAQDTRNLIANKVIKPTEFKALGAVAQYKGAA